MGGRVSRGIQLQAFDKILDVFKEKNRRIDL